MVENKSVINLIKMGISINQIRAKTGLAKSTIYFHYKKILGRKIPLVSINFKSKNELGEFLGIFAGDGYMIEKENYHYMTGVCIGYYEKDYADYLILKFREWFGKKPIVEYKKHEHKSSSIVLYYYSKDIHLFIKKYLVWSGHKTYSVRLKEFNLEDTEFNLGFLRGLIDTDGNYYAPKKRVSFSTVSKALGVQAYKIMKYNLDLEPYWSVYKKESRADLYTITLHGNSTEKLMNTVKLSNPHKIMR